MDEQLSSTLAEFLEELDKETGGSVVFCVWLRRQDGYRSILLQGDDTDAHTMLSDARQAFMPDEMFDLLTAEPMGHA